MLPRQTARPPARSRQVVTLIGGLVTWIVITLPALAAEPGRSPSRLIPARGLTLYVEYDGVRPHADAWKATAAYQILHETPTGALLADIALNLLTPDSTTPRGALMTGADYVALGEHIGQNGFAVACYDEDGETSAVVILNGFGVRESRDRFERFVRVGTSSGAEPAQLPRPVRHRRRDVYRVQDGNIIEPKPGEEAPAKVTWWFEGDDLILVPGSAGIFLDLLPIGGPNREPGAVGRARVARVLDAIEDKEPRASTHPGYAAALAEGKDLGRVEPAGLFFAEARDRLGLGILGSLRDMAESLPGVTKGGPNEFDFLDALDISRARRIVARWGFRGKSLVTDIRFEAPAPWNGLVGLLDPKGFPKDRLPPIPRGMGAFAVGAFVRGDLRAANASLGAAVIAKYRDGFRILDEALRNATSQRLRDDLFRHLGRTGCVFAAPSGTDDRADSTVPSFLIAIDDADAVGKALDALAARINAYFGEIQGGQRQAASGRPAIALERLPAPDRGYRLTSPAGLISWLTGELQPTILVGKSFVAVANNPVLARAAIAAEPKPAERWLPTGELAKIFESLPANVAFLCVGNTRDSFWPEALANLPELMAPYVGGLEAANAAGVPPAPRSLKLPKADAIRALLIPSVLAAVVDDRSFRLVSLEALPFGCLRTESQMEFAGLRQSLNIEFKFAPRR